MIQIKNFKTHFKREIGNNNKINDVIEFIKKHQFDYNLKDDEMFFIRLRYDDNEEPIIGTGSADNQCHLLVSTKKIDQFPAIFHLAATHKITINGFPLLVFGLSDVNRQFHKIAFMIKSNEKEPDHVYFYESLFQIAKKLKIRFRPQYIVQDGSYAMTQH